MSDVTAAVAAAEAAAGTKVDVQTVIPVAIGLLGTLLAGFIVVGLVVLCRRRAAVNIYSRKLTYVGLCVGNLGFPSSSRSELVENVECHQCQEDDELNAEDSVITRRRCAENDSEARLVAVGNGNGDQQNDNEALLHAQTRQINGVTDVASHCLAILRTVQRLTERLVSLSLRTQQQKPGSGGPRSAELMASPTSLTRLVAVTQMIGARADDVVEALYRHLDARQLEARCSALVYSVNHLVLLAKNSRSLDAMIDWVDQTMADIEDHLQMLRSESVQLELHKANNFIQSVNSDP